MRRARWHLLLGAFVLSVLATGITAAPALALSPAVATSPASSIAETTATLNGTVNPNGSETKFYFEYGTTTSYGSKTSEVSAGSGTATLEKNQSIGSLTKNTLYHYRIVASNAFGTSQGVDQTFITVGAPGVETTEGVPAPSGEAATLKADVDPNGQATTYQFEYGTESGVYTKTVPAVAESAGSGYEPKAVSYEVTGLTKNTTYYFRVTASNASGKANGAEKSFSTATASALTSPAGTALKVGAAISAVDEGEISLKAVTGEEEGFMIFLCKNSEFEGEVVENAESTAKGSLSKLSFAECGNHTVTVLKPGSIEFQSTGGGSGKLLSTGAEITILMHSFLIGTEHCIYNTEGTDIGVFSSSKNTGSTATVNTEKKSISPVSTGSFCGEKGKLEGSYSFTTPDYLDID